MATTFWRCAICGDRAATRDEAIVCCEPEPVQRWLCEICRTTYETKAEAERCETEDQKAAHSGEEGQDIPGVAIGERGTHLRIR